MKVCYNCRNKVSDNDSFCPYCGFDLKTNDNFLCKANRRNRKLGIFILAIIVGIILFLSIFLVYKKLYGMNKYEKEAKSYLKILEKIEGNIELDDVVCISKKYVGKSKLGYEYLFVYEKDGSEEFALFVENSEVVYAGDGYNGGNAKSKLQKHLNNIHSLEAQKTYLKYLMGEEKPIKVEDADKKKGFFLLDTDKIR